MLLLANNSCKDHWDKQQRWKPNLGVDQDHQYRKTLKIEGKADRTAMVGNLFAQYFD